MNTGNYPRGKENHFFRGSTRDPMRARAWSAVRNALRSGRLKRKPCVLCGSSGFLKNGRSAVQCHHENYRRPLQVVFLCKRCHFAVHQALFLSEKFRGEE